MANICEITGKKKLKGHRVSHANNKKIHFQEPNIQGRMMFIPELGQRVKIYASTQGLRTIDKHGGISRYIIRAKLEKLSPKLQKLRKVLIRKGVH